jgi:hypothetical protein
MAENELALQREMLIDLLLLKQKLMLEKAEKNLSEEVLAEINKKESDDEFYRKREIIFTADMDFKEFWNIKNLKSW